MSGKRHWRIAVFHNNTRVFSQSVPLHRLEHAGVEELLRRLMCHFVLTADEIVGASLNRRRGAPIKRDDLAVVRSTAHGGGVMMECGVTRASFATAEAV
jgi:hypothetical protein